MPTAIPGETIRHAITGGGNTVTLRLAMREGPRCRQNGTDRNARVVQRWSCNILR